MNCYSVDKSIVKFVNNLCISCAILRRNGG